MEVLVPWIDHQTDPKKLAAPLRIKVVAEACALANVKKIHGVMVKRDVTAEGFRLVAGPSALVPYGHIYEEER